MTASPASLVALLSDRRIIVVVRHGDPAAAAAIAQAAADGGLRAVEITTSVPGAAGLIATLRAALPADVIVGAGTVLSPAQLDDVLAAGVQFVVSPGLDGALVERCAEAQVPILPGVHTATEVMAGRALGLDAMKLFPAQTGGPAHLQALRAVFPDTAFVPTGGVDSSNAAAWLEAGAHALGLASEFDAAHRDGGDDAVRRLAERLRESFETDSSAFISGAPS
jgi:2-dehydro-3-deoxyphosphogluconate aldolase / (4S)-4-hydroxy-2-oxoglutarate aldolase